MNPETANTLLEHGTNGVLVVIILSLLAPISAGIVWQLRSMNLNLRSTNLAAVREREDTAKNANQERQEQSDRYERLVQMQADRHDRQAQTFADTLSKLTSSSIDGSNRIVLGIQRLATRLEERPCLLGSRLMDNQGGLPNMGKLGE